MVPMYDCIYVYNTTSHNVSMCNVHTRYMIYYKSSIFEFRDRFNFARHILLNRMIQAKSPPIAQKGPNPRNFTAAKLSWFTALVSGHIRGLMGIYLKYISILRKKWTSWSSHKSGNNPHLLGLPISLLILHHSAFRNFLVLSSGNDSFRQMQKSFSPWKSGLQYIKPNN